MARKFLWFAGVVMAMLLAVVPAPGGLLPAARAQGESRLFAETGKTVRGRFLEYWSANGGLAQQGYPISEEIEERSEVDGKTYRVQYFERAVFELHPENSRPFDVLLSLLGRFEYERKYPNGAPGQRAIDNAGSRLFPETGKRVGGRFLEYWNANGGLAQQGYPISDEFEEQSDLDGKTYRVQYFERAVFELHPENSRPFDVLLSQLGTFRHRARYAGGPGAEPEPVPPPRKLGWSRIEAANEGPSPRYDHSAVLDPVRQQLVIFGGRGRSTFGDTWILDLSSRTWREAANGPPARFGHGTVYDPAGRRMIVVMGEGSRFFNDVWAFDLDNETWTQLKENRNGPDAPRTRYGQSAALDGRGRVIVSHGFSDQGRFDDTWAFDLSSNSWADLTPHEGKPLKRCLHELTYDAAGDRVILFGGCSSGHGPCPQGDMWAFDLKSNTWSELEPAGAKPSPRSNPSFAYDAAARRIMLFGGIPAGAPSAESWSLDLAANSWTELGPGAGPSGRSSQGTAPDPAGRRLIIFGGNTAEGPAADIWEWRY